MRAPVKNLHPAQVSRKVWVKQSHARHAKLKQARQLREQQLQLQQQQDTAHLEAERAAQALVVLIQKVNTNPFPPGFLSIPPDPTPPVSQKLREYPLFYNKVVTKEQSWDFQFEIPEWTKVYDRASTMYYYHNNKTQENAWVEPEGYEPPPEGHRVQVDPVVRAAIIIQTTYRIYRRSQKLLRHQHQDQTRRRRQSKNALPPGIRVSSDSEEVSFTLDYPNTTDPEREEEEALEVDKPVGKKRKRGTPNSKTGLIGVYKSSGDKYTAMITYGGITNHLGSFDTKEQAGIAYDRFVVDKSTEEVSYTLNFPKMSDHEREEALKEAKASSSSSPKKCSKCTRMHTAKFQLCETCRTNSYHHDSNVPNCFECGHSIRYQCSPRNKSHYNKCGYYDSALAMAKFSVVDVDGYTGETIYRNRTASIKREVQCTCGVAHGRGHGGSYVKFCCNVEGCSRTLYFTHYGQISKQMKVHKKDHVDDLRRRFNGIDGSEEFNISFPHMLSKDWCESYESDERAREKKAHERAREKKAYERARKKKAREIAEKTKRKRIKQRGVYRGKTPAWYRKQYGDTHPITLNIFSSEAISERSHEQQMREAQLSLDPMGAMRDLHARRSILAPKATPPPRPKPKPPPVKIPRKDGRANNSSGFRGVFQHGKKYRVQIDIKGIKRKKYGTYPTRKEAALAYDQLVVEHSRPKEWLNFPGEVNKHGNKYTFSRYQIRKSNCKNKVDEYIGTLSDDGKKHGSGKMIYHTGTVYEGTWKDDKRDGHGTFVYPNGNKYVGAWVNDQRSGDGEWTMLNESIYSNILVIYRTYVGDWKFDRQHGHGKTTWRNGDIHFGMYENGVSSGHGEWNDANGDIYVGAWKYGEYHGEGTWTGVNGDKYVGAYKDGKRDGQGTYTWADGDKYVGAWKDGKSNGKGTHTYASGNKYVGAWKDGERHGEGTQTTADGTSWTGEWVNDKRKIK